MNEITKIYISEQQKSTPPPQYLSHKKISYHNLVKCKMNSVTWNGTDQNDNPVSSGVYLYWIKADRFNSKNRKMLLLKQEEKLLYHQVSIRFCVSQNPIDIWKRGNQDERINTVVIQY